MLCCWHLIVVYKIGTIVLVHIGAPSSEEIHAVLPKN